MAPHHGNESLGMSGLICSIYDAALDAPRWQEFLARFAVEFSSQAAVIFGQDFSDRSVEVTGAPASLAAHHGVEAGYMQSFADHYCRTNVWTENEHLHHEGQVVNASRLYPEARLPRTEWHGDWLRPQGLFHSMAAVVEKREQRSLNLTVLRSKRQGPYTEAEEARLHALAPHLRTAFALHRRLHHAQALAHASLAVLENLPMGVVLLDERAALLHANQRAHSLAHSSGLLRFTAHALAAINHNDDLQLQAAMHRAATTGRGLPLHAGCALRFSGGGGSLHLTIAPLPRWSSPFGEHAAGAVFISDPTANIPAVADALRAFYCLTPAEALLAQALVNGLSPQEYAQQRGLSIHTVRAQLKAATAKVGTSRQADFVRAILTSPALLWQGAAHAPAAERR